MILVGSKIMEAKLLEVQIQEAPSISDKSEVPSVPDTLQVLSIL